MNEAGQESGNGDAVTGRTIPLLQDTATVGAWQSWAVTYRDVVIVDGQGKRRGAYNLTQHDLSNPANLAELRALLEAAR